MLSTRKLSIVPPSLWHLDDVRETVSRGPNKRPYLADCKPLTSVFTLKNFFLQILKASLIPLNLVMHEFNMHMMECEKRGYDTDFDWQACLEKHFIKFQSEAQRMVSISILKKFAEEFVVTQLSPSLADKLTKDLVKSFVRKVKRFPTRLIATQKVVLTALRGNAIQYSTLCLYDVCYKHCEETWKFIKNWRSVGFSKACELVPVLELSKHSAKKVFYYALCWLSSSAGFACGSYFSDTKGGMIGSLLFELIASLSLSGVV